MSGYSVEEIMSSAYPVMPVIAVQKVEEAVPLAKALVAGGLKVLEVTLRTDAAMDAIKAMKSEVPEAIVGAGTVINDSQLKQLAAIDADFAISPGATPTLLKAGKNVPFPFLPAVASVSEMMVAMESGYEHFKFFPAQASGGVKALKAIAGPFPKVKFCPTGGISLENYNDYLALKNVVCVGGSWVVPADVIANGDWDKIEALAKEACALVKA